jgi:hypothetical protein
VAPAKSIAPTAPPAVAATKPGSAGAPKPKPAPAPSEPETSKSATPPGVSSITLAMRQMGEEAAQKAKDMKKKTVEVLVGTGKGEAAGETTPKDTKGPPSPVTTTAEPASISKTVEPITVLQDPETSAWNKGPGEKPSVAYQELNELKSLQSPTSTAWKPADVNPPIRSHRGSEISAASIEEIRAIEQEQAIGEEDEEDEEEDEEDEEDDGDDDEEEEEDDDDEEEEDEVEKKSKT